MPQGAINRPSCSSRLGGRNCQGVQEWHGNVDKGTRNERIKQEVPAVVCLLEGSLISFLTSGKAASVHPIVDSWVDPAVDLVNGRPQVFRVQVQIWLLGNAVKLTASSITMLRQNHSGFLTMLLTSLMAGLRSSG